MPVNDFKPFGAGPGESITSQTDYSVATWRVEGWRSGILPHQQINKVLRQTSTVTAALAQSVSDLAQIDVFDNGNVTQLTNAIKTAFSAYLPYNTSITYPPGSIGHAIQTGIGAGATPPTAAQLKTILANQLAETEFTSQVRNRLNQIDAPTTGLVTKVADLQAVFGSTTSAANSATAAAQSSIDAVAARNAAQVAAGAALTSETNANTSRTQAATSAGAASTSANQAATSATSAAGSASSASTSATTASTAATSATNSATAAASSASSAGTSATSAGTFATAADSSRTQAATSAASAVTSRDNAASSATSAAGSAATATTRAQQALTSEGNAAASASAAASSATTAGAHATTAGTQASIATTKAIEASTAATNASNSATAAANSAASALTRSNEAGSFATAAQSSSVTAQAAANSAQAALGETARSNRVDRSQVVTNGGGAPAVELGWGLSGWGFRFVGTGAVQFGQLNVAPLVPSAVYSVSFQARLTSGSSQSINVDFFPDTLPEVSRTVTSTPTTFKWENVSSASGDWSIASLRFFKDFPVGVTVEITDIKLELNNVASPFVSNPKDVQFYAQAAATSSASATASASAASSSASAAQTARIAAETAQGAASSSQTAAASSATTAAGSASAANNSAVTAANAATAAGTSATAANTSAASASASAGNADTSAQAAANWYNQTVSATGGLTSAVTLKADTSVVTALAGRVATTEANLSLKVVATRSDGKQVIGGIGLASAAAGTVGQSEILLQADKLVFVPASDPNAGITRPFVIGTLNGVTTVVVDGAVIGDLTVRSASIISLDANKITARTIAADKFVLNSATVSVATNMGVTFQGTGGLGGGGSFASIGGTADAAPYTQSGFPALGKLLGVVTVPHEGQTLHCAVTGTLNLSFGSNWSGPGAGLHEIDAQVTLSIYKATGTTLPLTRIGGAGINPRDITWITPSRERRIPFSLSAGAPAEAGTYVAILTFNVGAQFGDTGALLSCFNPALCAAPMNVHFFSNAI